MGQLATLWGEFSAEVQRDVFVRTGKAIDEDDVVKIAERLSVTSKQWGDATARQKVVEYAVQRDRPTIKIPAVHGEAGVPAWWQHYCERLMLDEEGIYRDHNGVDLESVARSYRKMLGQPNGEPFGREQADELLAWMLVDEASANECAFAIPWPTAMQSVCGGCPGLGESRFVAFGELQDGQVVRMPDVLSWESLYEWMAALPESQGRWWVTLANVAAESFMVSRSFNAPDGSLSWGIMAAPGAIADYILTGALPRCEWIDWKVGMGLDGRGDVITLRIPTAAASDVDVLIAWREAKKRVDEIYGEMWSEGITFDRRVPKTLTDSTVAAYQYWRDTPEMSWQERVSEWNIENPDDPLTVLTYRRRRDRAKKPWTIVRGGGDD